MAATGVSLHSISHRSAEPLRLVNQPALQPVTGTTLGQQNSNGLPLPPAPSNLPLRPTVQADNEDANLMPFFDVLATIMPPTSLQVTNTGQRAQEQQCIFYLSLHHVNQISTNRYKNESANRVEYPVQVQLRCLKILPGPQSDAFPTGVSCRLNKQMATLPPVIPTNKPNAEPQRPGRPVNLTPLCRLSPNMPNMLHMGYNYDSAASYCVQVCLVRALTPEDLIDRIRDRGVRPADFTRAMIRDKLIPSDFELAVTELVASLMCPLGKMRICVPMRSAVCSHVQCFDAYCYLAMNAKKPVWKCPFCDQAAPYGQLYIDAYFLEVLASRDSAGLDRLQFKPDGSWCAATATAGNGDLGAGIDADSPTSTPTLSNAATAGGASTTTTATASAEVAASNLVDLTLSDDDDGGGGGGSMPRPPPPPPQPSQPPQPPPRAEQPVIVINLDSSDEEN